MGVDVEMYRSRIGSFNPSRHYSYKTTIKKTDQARKKNYFYIIIRTLLVILQVFVLVRQHETFLQTISGVYSTRPVQG